MSFTAAAFLLGTFAVAGPILAHLLARPRFRRVPFTMLHFLYAGQAEMESRRRLRDLLLLLLRCAIIVLLVLFFAGPSINTGKKQTIAKASYFLAVDNSLSMNYREGSRSLYQNAIDATAEFIQKSDEDAQFNLYPLAGAEPITELDRNAALVALRQIRTAPLQGDLRSYLSDLREAGISNPDAKIHTHIASDFTPPILQQITNLSEPIVVDSFQYEFSHPQEEISNCTIYDGDAKVGSDDTIQLQATLINDGPEPVRRTVVIRNLAQELHRFEVDLDAGEHRRIERGISFDTRPTSSYAIEIAYLEGDGLAEDDTYCMGLSIPKIESKRILVAGVNSRETFLPETAFQTLARNYPGEAIGVETITANVFNARNLQEIDLLVLTSIQQSIAQLLEPLTAFVKTGGRIVFFVSPMQSPACVQTFWEAGLLPALPQRLRSETTHTTQSPETSIENLPRALDVSALQALQNYKIGQAVLTGYYECEAKPDSLALWRLEDGPGFLYYSSLGLGSVLLVNTSADDSLGTLLKSPVSVAFCRTILGRQEPLQTHIFTSGEPIVLPKAENMKTISGSESGIQILSPNGNVLTAALTDFGIVLPPLQEIGWIKTAAEPALYAGINPPREELNLQQPEAQTLDASLHAIFQKRTEPESALQAKITTGTKPIWKQIGWVLIALILTETVVANRLKR